MQITTYLNFGGNCEAAFKFYADVFGGKIVMMMKGGDMPPGTPMPPDFKDMIIHARLQIGNQFLMGSDAPPERFQKPQGFSVNIGTDNVAEAERLYAALSKDGSIQMALEKTFWAERFAMFTDKFGIAWMVNCEVPR